MNLRRRIHNLEAWFQGFRENWWSNDQIRELAQWFDYPEDDMIKVFRKALPWGYLDANGLPTLVAEMEEFRPEWRIGSRQRTSGGGQPSSERTST